MGQMVAGYFVFMIILGVIGFIIWVALTRWLFRVNDIHNELVRIRTAIESMDSYIVGVRKKSSGVVEEENKPNPAIEDKKQESKEAGKQMVSESRTCSRCGRDLYYPGELEKGLCRHCS